MSQEVKEFEAKLQEFETAANKLQTYLNDCQQYLDEKIQEEKGNIQQQLQTLESYLAGNPVERLSQASDPGAEFTRVLQKAKQLENDIRSKESFIQSYVEEALGDKLNAVKSPFMTYSLYRKMIEREIKEDKVFVAANTSQLLKTLEKMVAVESNKDKKEALTVATNHLKQFLSSLKAIDYRSLQQSDIDLLTAQFKDAAENYHHSEGFFSRSATKGSLKKLTKDNLGPLADSFGLALLYGEAHQPNGTLSKCDQFQEELDDKVKALSNKGQADASVKASLEKFDILYIEPLKDAFKEADPEGAQAVIEQVEATAVPDQIDWIRKTFGLANWVYENFGAAAGKYLIEKANGQATEEGQQPTISTGDLLKYKISTPDYEVNLDVPLFDVGFVDAGLELGAAFKAAFEVAGALTLHNFFDPNIEKVVSGNIGASATAEAKAFLGIYVAILKIVKASARAVLAAEAAIGGEAAVSLNKGNIAAATNFAFDAELKGGLSFKGYLEFAIGATAIIKAILDTIGIPAEAKLQYPEKGNELVILNVERAASMHAHIPFQKKDVPFPAKEFDISKGEWLVEYPFIEDMQKFFSDKFSKLTSKTIDMEPLTAQELETLKAEYAKF
ncbi:hypothetical protein [Saprospira grandis]|uniref:hypothetical protein n=1 Tax=Saprospira grandis TaxID=1008 RepID=UPI0022DE64F5|nr:hypothetical protein [Saprospira grandis]WBM73476.1 hypothetical protein OP864_10790 [Saprospira grandis]